MEKHKLVQILKTFSKEEFSEFEKFIASPYHNEGRNFMPLIKELKKYYPAFSNKNFTKENIFRKLHPHAKYNPSLMDTMISRIMKIADSFLLHNALEKYKFEKSTMLMKEFMNRNLNFGYLKYAESAEKILDDDTVFDMDFLEKKRILETIKTDYLLAQKDFFKSHEGILKRGDYVILSFVLKLLYSLQDIYLTGYELRLDLKNNLVENFPA